MSNNTFRAVMIVTAVAVLFAVTKPDDRQCIREGKRILGLQVQQSSLLGQLVNEITAPATDIMINVEDHIFYKTVFSSVDGRVVAIAALGCVMQQ